MGENKLFILNAVLLVGLIAGVSHLQKLYSPGAAPKTLSSNAPATEWRLASTTTPVPVSTKITVAASVPKKSAPPPVAPTSVRHRVYSESQDDDN